MRKNQPALVLGALGLFASSFALAQNYQKMPVQSGFNEDVIANGIGSALSSTTSILDGDSFVFVAKDFQATATSAPITYGVPVDGIINSVVTTTPGLSYQLGNLSGPNSLRLSTANPTGTITFTTPKAAFTLYMLATGGSGASTQNVTVNFSDGTNQQFTGISISDWYDGAGFAVQGLGRINRTNNTLESSSTNPRMYQLALPINAANQAKLIQSVTITKTSTTATFPNIFAFSVDEYSTCVPPTLQAAGSITANSATISWTAPTGSTPASYDIYYSTSNTIPSSTATPNFAGETGTSKTIPSLNPNTVYYYWVRSNCSTGTSQSSWSFGGTFKTACGAMTSMVENFDSYTTGNIVPDCWVRNAGTGSMTISSTSPASGTRNIYQNVSSTGTPSTVVLPEFSNINAGTNWLRFKAKVSSATGTLKVGYVTNPTDASTFVLLQALSITNTTYTNSEYTVIVPNTVPANARLAIQNTADAKSYYWDDVYWEPLPSCFAPTTITSSNVASFSATIGWTAPSTAPANGYDVYYSTSNVAPTSSTVLNSTNSVPATTTSAQLTTLASSTTYYIWVRSNCSSTDKSTWTGPISITTPSFCPTVTAPAAGATGVSVTPSITWNAVTGAAGYRLTVGTTAGGTDVLNNIDVGNVTTYPFTISLAFNTKYYYTVNAYAGGQTSSSCTENNFTTACTSIGTPYVLDFESVTTPALPGCTYNVNAGTGNNWTTADAPTDCPGLSTKVLRYAWNSSNAANTWFFTQGLNLTAGTQYTISYKYGNNSTTYVEKLKVAFGTSATAAAMVNAIADYPSINDKTAHTASVNFTVPTTGIYYFGFNAYSTANQYYLYVDDISVNNANLATSEVSANKNTVQAYPNPFTDVLNISDIKNVKSVSVMDIAGRLIKNIEKPSSTLHLGDLKEGLYLVVLNMNDGSKQTIKAIKK
ncbi:fibronectin type III domain-containing protein [Chryseobacterium geocarposphaerae]|uniref:Putative secreted protein (Por secretion system target) n=1 Tax=Chryseobacterium geocarposphaerae TaxID=1416776 RepID=A0A2M9CB03_9FLAO|nr:fibronectin type III domain-containing protein [Chryseobacterium geocarposphaerae]PJJ67952.1 putative secreted protein (Por secretion system target) [Chryseobacterium geocarposphaerae]